MNKKLILKYILMYIPMVLGIILFSSGVFNIVSSLLLFVGGYIAIKNTFDYRLVRKNIKSVSESNESKDICVRNSTPVNMIGIKRVKRNTRVRKRVKY